MSDGGNDVLSEILDELRGFKTSFDDLRTQLSEQGKDLLRATADSANSSFAVKSPLDRLVKLFELAFSQQLVGGLSKVPDLGSLAKIADSLLDKILGAYKDQPEASERLQRFKAGRPIKFRNPETAEPYKINGMREFIELSLAVYLEATDSPLLRPLSATFEILLTGIAMGEDDGRIEEYCGMHSKWAEHSSLE